MPNRIIKESICESDSLSKLTWFEQILFFRLIVLADDYGCYDGRVKVIRGHAFPLENVTDKQVEEGVRSLACAGIVQHYTVGGRPYLHIETWEAHQRVRDSKHKYPTPEDADDIKPPQTAADDNNSPQLAATRRDSPQPAARACEESQSESESVSESEKDAQARVDVPTDDISPLERAILEFIAYRKKLRKPMTDKAIEMLRKKVPSLGKTDTERVAAIEQSIYRGWTDVYPFQSEPPYRGRRKNEVYHDQYRNQHQIDEDMDQLLKELENGIIT